MFGHCFIQGGTTLLCLSLATFSDLESYSYSKIIEEIIWFPAKCMPSAFDVFNKLPALKIVRVESDCCFGCPANRPEAVTYEPDRCACESWTLVPANETATSTSAPIRQLAAVAVGGVTAGIIITSLLFILILLLRRRANTADTTPLFDDEDTPGDALFSVNSGDDGDAGQDVVDN